MTFPPEILDEIYARAIPDHETFFMQMGDLTEARREITRRFVNAIWETLREEREAMVEE